MTTEAANPGEFDIAVMRSAKRGEADPKRIVANLVKRNGLDWLSTSLSEIVVAVAERRAADLLRNHRRAAERKASDNARTAVAEGRTQTSATKPTGTTNMRKKLRQAAARADAVEAGMMAVAEIADEKVHIEGRGWIRYGFCTSADFRARKLMYERIAGTLTKRALWSGEIADFMDSQAVTMLDDLTYIPPIPNGESPASMADDETVTSDG